MYKFNKREAKKHFSNIIWFLYYMGAIQISYNKTEGWFCSGRLWHPIMWVMIIISFFVAGIEGVTNRFGDIFGFFCKPSKYTYWKAPK
jgi:hypothetical protein